MFTNDSSFIDFINECVKLGDCGDSIDWMNAQVKVNPKITFGEAMSNYLADDKADEGWADFQIRNRADNLNADLRKGFISKIQREMTAFQIYKDCAFLTDEEDKLLEAIFIKDGKHLLPTAEEEMRTGKIVRAKT